MISCFIILAFGLIPAVVLKAMLKKPIPKPTPCHGDSCCLAHRFPLHSLNHDRKAYWLHAAAVISYIVLAPKTTQTERKE